MKLGYSICLILVFPIEFLCQADENTDREKRHLDKQFMFQKTLDFGNKVVHSEGNLNLGPGGFSHEKHIKIIKSDPRPSLHHEFQHDFSHFGHAQTFQEAQQYFNGIGRDPKQNTMIFFNNQNSPAGFNVQNNHIQNSGVSATKTVDIEKIHSFNIKKSDQFFSSTTQTLRSAQTHSVPPHHANNIFDHMTAGEAFGRNPDKQKLDV